MLIVVSIGRFACRLYTFLRLIHIWPYIVPFPICQIPNLLQIFFFSFLRSIRHLQDASNTDGKAATNLIKLRLFRQFYLMIVCYIYFTRIIVYLLKATVPFQYVWLDEMFKEAATFIFYVMTAYKFRPVPSHPYFIVDTDDEGDDEVEV